MSSVQATGQNSQSNYGSYIGAGVGTIGGAVGLYKTNKTFEPIKSAIKSVEKDLIPATRLQEDSFKKAVESISGENGAAIKKELTQLLNNGTVRNVLETQAKESFPESFAQVQNVLKAIDEEKGALSDKTITTLFTNLTNGEVEYLEGALKEGPLAGAADEILGNIKTIQKGQAPISDIAGVILKNKDLVMDYVTSDEFKSTIIADSKTYLNMAAPETAYYAQETIESAKLLADAFKTEVPDKATLQELLAGLGESGIQTFAQGISRYVDPGDVRVLEASMQELQANAGEARTAAKNIVSTFTANKKDIVGLFQGMRKPAIDVLAKTVETEMPETYKAVVAGLQAAKKEITPESILTGTKSVISKMPETLKDAPKTKELLSTIEAATTGTIKQQESFLGTIKEVAGPISSKIQGAIRSVNLSDAKSLSDILQNGCNAVKKTTNKYFGLAVAACLALIPAGFGIGTLVDKGIDKYNSSKTEQKSAE